MPRQKRKPTEPLMAPTRRSRRLHGLAPEAELALAGPLDAQVQEQDPVLAEAADQLGDQDLGVLAEADAQEQHQEQEEDVDLEMAEPEVEEEVAEELSRGAQAVQLLQGLAAKVDALEDGELPTLDEPATQANACWNFALYGNRDDAADPASGFLQAANAEDSPFQAEFPGHPDFGMRARPGMEDAQPAFHEDQAKVAIQAAGWTLQADSALKIAYQWVPGTCQYHHWELWYEVNDTFVSVAKFPGKPVHAKNTQTDLQAENLQQVEVGVDPDSISELHLARLRALLASQTTQDDIYG